MSSSKREEKDRTKKGQTKTPISALQPKTDVTHALLDKAASVAQNMRYVTPYSLSQKLEVPISVSRKLLRELASRGIVKLYASGKRDPIYVPIKQQK